MIVVYLISSTGDYFLVSTAMRAPAILSQCLPGLVPRDHGSLSISSVPEKAIHLASPAVEILPSKVQLPFSSSAIETPLNNQQQKWNFTLKVEIKAFSWIFCPLLGDWGKKRNRFIYVMLCRRFTLTRKLGKILTILRYVSAWFVS